MESDVWRKIKKKPAVNYPPWAEAVESVTLTTPQPSGFIVIIMITLIVIVMSACPR